MKGCAGAMLISVRRVGSRVGNLHREAIRGIAFLSI